MAFSPETYALLANKYGGGGGSDTDSIRYYGVCSTNASTQEKKVDIEGFTSENLVEGTCIAVRFSDMQLYDGIPKLNVSDTGAKNIQSRAGTNAGKGEWYTGQVVEFVFYNNAWVIIDGFHATTNYYGKTKLTNDFSVIDMNSAATGQMVTALAGFVAKGWLWDGNEHEPTVLVDTLTPDGGDWDYYAQGLDICTIHYTDFASAVNYNPYYMRMLKITFGNQVFYKGLLYSRPFERETVYFDDEQHDAYFSIGTAETTIVAPAGYAEITFKVELYSGYGDAGLVTYPMLKAYNEPFIVTCTPTAQDFSGTMDKTVAEIDTAFKAGRRVFFNVAVSGVGNSVVECTQAGYMEGVLYPSYNAYIIYDSMDAIIGLFTLTTNDGSKDEYSTIIYPLNRLSS